MLPLLHHAVLVKRVQCGPVICIISVPMRLMRENSRITSGCFRGCVWGRHLFKGNQHIQNLKCSSGRVDALHVLIFEPLKLLCPFSEYKVNRVVSERNKKNNSIKDWWQTVAGISRCSASAMLSFNACRSVIQCGKLAYASPHSHSEGLTSPERALFGL